MKLRFNSPNCISCAIQSASLTSVLRPGTCLKCRALTIHTSNSSASTLNTGFQYTPVLSIATWVTPKPVSQAAKASRPASVVAKVLSGVARPRRWTRRTSDDNTLVDVQAGTTLEHDFHLVPPVTALAYPIVWTACPTCLLPEEGSTSRGMSRYADLLSDELSSYWHHGIPIFLTDGHGTSLAHFMRRGPAPA